jgi:lipoprotein signal peptidase
MHVAFWVPVMVLGLFISSIVNVLSNGSFMFAVSWPLIGIAFSIFGFGVAFSAPSDERWKLVLANVLLLILAFVSIVAPN